MTKSNIRRVIAILLCVAAVTLAVLGAVNMPKRESAEGQAILSALRIRTLLKRASGYSFSSASTQRAPRCFFVILSFLIFK